MAACPIEFILQALSLSTITFFLLFFCLSLFPCLLWDNDIGKVSIGFNLSILQPYLCSLSHYISFHPVLYLSHYLSLYPALYLPHSLSLPFPSPLSIMRWRYREGLIIQWFLYFSHISVLFYTIYLLSCSLSLTLPLSLYFLFFISHTHSLFPFSLVYYEITM